MKVWTILIILILSLQVKGQNEPCFYLTKASNYYCKGKYKKAAKTLIKFREAHPGHELAEESMYNIGLSYYQKGKYKKAATWFEKLISIKEYPDNEKVFQLSDCEGYKAECTVFFIADRLLSLQHEACINLAKIGLETGDYHMARTQIINADQYYRFWYGCGTDDLREDLRISLLYSDLFTQLGKPDSAIHYLLEDILEPAAMPVAFYMQVVDEAVFLLKQQYSQPELKKLMEEAVENIDWDEFEDHGKEARTYYINLLGVRVKVAPEYLFNHNYQVQEVQDYIRDTKFYKDVVGE